MSRNNFNGFAPAAQSREAGFSFFFKKDESKIKDFASPFRALLEMGKPRKKKLKG